MVPHPQATVFLSNLESEIRRIQTTKGKETDFDVYSFFEMYVEPLKKMGVVAIQLLAGDNKTGELTYHLGTDDSPPHVQYPEDRPGDPTIEINRLTLIATIAMRNQIEENDAEKQTLVTFIHAIMTHQSSFELVPIFED